MEARPRFECGGKSIISAFGFAQHTRAKFIGSMLNSINEFQSMTNLGALSVSFKSNYVVQ